jgi:hypothetical protein
LFLIATEIGAIVVALWMILFAWFDALPSFKLFARIFPQIRSYFLVRYPSFIYVAVITNSLFTCIASFGVFFLFSYVRPDKIPTVVVPWGVSVFGIELAVFMCILSAVCVLLLRLINVFSAESSSGNKSPRGGGGLSSEAKKRFRDAKRTVWSMLISVLGAGPWAITLCFVMAWNPFASANFFFFVALLQGAGAAVSIFATYVFVFRMHYAARRSIDTTALTNGNGLDRAVSNDGSISLGGDFHSPNPKFSVIGQEKSSFA